MTPFLTFPFTRTSFNTFQTWTRVSTENLDRIMCSIDPHVNPNTVTYALHVFTSAFLASRQTTYAYRRAASCCQSNSWQVVITHGAWNHVVEVSQIFLGGGLPSFQLPDGRGSSQ